MPHLNFTLYNESSISVYHLYVKAARSNRWGADILSNPLRSGEYTRITFPNQNSDSPCIYDIKAVLADRSEKSGRFNLCERDSVTVR